MPYRNGFIGIDHRRVVPPLVDYLAVDQTYGVDRAESYFGGEGRQHGDLLVRELASGMVHRVDNYPALVDSVALFEPGDWVHRAYTDGLLAQLAYLGNCLRGIAALRDLSLPASFITGPHQVLVCASDMPNEDCLTLAAALDRFACRVEAGMTATTGDRLSVRTRTGGFSGDLAVGWRFSAEVADAQVQTVADNEQQVCWIWWEPPEIVGQAEFPDGLWLIAAQGGAEEMPHYGDALAAGPIDAAADWLAARCGCPADALVRGDDFAVGVYARRPDGAMDHRRVDRWITCRRYSVQESALTGEQDTPAT
jgi:hypothetical protein